MHETVNRSKKYDKYMKSHSKLTYQLSFSNVSRKLDYHAGGKWFIHGPKRHKENQLHQRCSKCFEASYTGITNQIPSISDRQN